ncbi:MAG: HNH endonuclease signature motif containing protein [Candidatus Limnocylindria bacterium]
MRRNAAKAREAMRRWRAAHPEVKRERARLYYLLHQETTRTRVVVWQAANPERVRAIRHRRRAREASAEGSFTWAEWVELVERHGQRCAYCGSDGPLHADHRVPLCRGGPNAIENILPGCRSCNLRKFTSTEAEFRERLKRESGGGSFEAAAE